MSAAVRAGYKLTEVGVIPEDWDALAMSKLFQLKQGVQCPVERQSTVDGKGLRRFIRIVDLTNPKEDWRYIVDPGSAHHLEITDLFMVRYGSPGLVGLGYSGVVANNLFRLIPRSNIEGHFYYQYLAQRQDEIAGLSGSSTMPAVSFSTLNHFYVVNPPLLEQRAIATALSDVDALLAKLDALVAKKRDLKVAIMQQLLTGQTRLPGFSGEWEAKLLGDVAFMGSGGTPPSSVAAYYDGDYPWVSIADMTKGGKAITKTDKSLSSAGLANSAAQMFPAGTILYAMYASLGECSIAGMPLCTSQAILGIRPQEALSNEFLYYYLTSLKNVVKSMGQQGTQANLNKGMVRAFELNLPPIQEQTAIATVLSDMDAELTALEARRDKIRALKQGMMQELLTGRIRLVESRVYP